MEININGKVEIKANITDRINKYNREAKLLSRPPGGRYPPQEVKVPTLNTPQTNISPRSRIKGTSNSRRSRTTAAEMKKKRMILGKKKAR